MIFGQKSKPYYTLSICFIEFINDCLYFQFEERDEPMPDILKPTEEPDGVGVLWVLPVFSYQQLMWLPDAYLWKVVIQFQHPSVLHMGGII